jgi:hypothetical protein
MKDTNKVLKGMKEKEIYFFALSSKKATNYKPFG